MTDKLAPLKAWWLMREADAEAADRPLNDEQVVLRHMGSGACAEVTVGELRAALNLEPGGAAPVPKTFQESVSAWMEQCFLPSLYSNMTERGDRLLEEVLELLQSKGYDPQRVATLVDYVWNRPVGDPAQEVGGVMVTLAGYCWIAGLDMHAAGDTELARINKPDVMAKIRAKQEAKNALHFDTPLPGASTLDSATLASATSGSALCGGCHQPIKPDALTGTTCACATPSAAVDEGVPVAWLVEGVYDSEDGPTFCFVRLNAAEVVDSVHSTEFSRTVTPLYSTTPTKPGQDTVLLGELLAVLHRDGGHYQAEHGTEKAVKDAIDAFYAKPGHMVVPGLTLIAEKLQKFVDSCEDEDSGGCNMSREWFDALTTIGFLERVQRSPAIWELTKSGRAMLNATQGGEKS